MKSSLIQFSESFKVAEENVSDSPGSYKGTDVEALCTQPEDVFSIINDPLIHGTWVDLGSGFGHTVITYAETFPERMAVGIEREDARRNLAVEIAREKNVKCHFIAGDLLTHNIPDGDTFFLYFPQGHVLDRILCELSRRETFTLVVIESHGDLFPRIEKEKWLKLIKEVRLKSERHNGFARIYRPERGERKLFELHRHSFLAHYFLIKDDLGMWWGESFGLCAMGNDYLLQTPPRTVRENDVVKIMTISELSPLMRFLISLRKLPDVTIFANGKLFKGPLRKIHETPAISVEFSDGERVHWGDIGRITQGTHLCYDSSSPSFFLPPVH